MVAIPVVILAMYAAFAIGAVVGWLLGVAAESRRAAYQQNSQALSFVVKDVAAKDEAMREAANVRMEPIGDLPHGNAGKTAIMLPDARAGFTGAGSVGKLWKGCCHCHGSGGKLKSCAFCKGSGKLSLIDGRPFWTNDTERELILSYDFRNPTNGN